MDFAPIRLLILDVDGVLTDGRVTIGPEGETTKTFHARDGAAIKLWRARGGQVAILSGRSSPAVRYRAAELGIEIVHLGVEDKLAGYETILASAGCENSAVAYVGDDLPDLEPMRRCGLPVAVADAAAEVKKVAYYITRLPGGRGAVAEVVELLLRKQKRWSESLFT